MKLYAIRILVNDWNNACDFYGQTLGLELEFKDDGFGWAEFSVGSAKLGIERATPDDAALVGRFLGISLQVDNVEQSYQSLKAKGVEFTAPPETQIWGGVLAHFKDPSGNILTLMSEPGA